MADCLVCYEKLNLQNHKKVNCSFCDFISCRTCVQTYLLSISIDPHCMNCKNLWNREVIDQACTKLFRNTKLKNHRENILFEREKCLMPDTQPFVAQIIRTRKISKEIHEIYNKIQEFHLVIRRLEASKHSIGELNQVVEKREFVRKCPVTDCKGFLSSRWKCQICENNICAHCNEIKEDNIEHVCDQNNVETVNLLKKDTKPCPSCGTMIFKISGCAQMWCPDCHTAFDWNTMKIELGRIHNPHYYEFKKNNQNTNRELGDIPCGGLPTIGELSRYRTHEHVFKIHRLVTHILFNELPFLINNQENNQNIRIKYMLNEITEDAMKHHLQKIEKSREKKRDITNVIRMFSDVISDFMRQLVLKELNIDDFVTNVINLRNYVNLSFETIYNRYNCSTPYINDIWVYSKFKKKHQQVVVVE